MARLLRVHFASIGHPDARLAPVTLDLRARNTTGSGVDTVLWLRNGGGKSTILNLFYALFRPDRRDFLGASAEGRARHLEDYVKADDLAFVVTEWDVDPSTESTLFATAPAQRRIVGMVLAWRDRQRSSDPSRLRRRFFAFKAGPGLDLGDLPVDGLGPEPSRSWDAFRDWLDRTRQERPELEPVSEEAPRRWADHLERIGLDPELFRYQLRMNAREGSADEAFRFRTTAEFVKFTLEVAFDPTEADLVSANLEGFRDKLARRPALVAERAFLEAARASLGPLLAAVQRQDTAEAGLQRAREAAAAVRLALLAHGARCAEEARVATARSEEARSRAEAASNDAARFGRWANGLERRAVELTLEEATAARASAERAHADAAERLAVAHAVLARDARRAVQARRDAKDAQMRAARLEREPLRREVARAGTVLRAGLEVHAGQCDVRADRHLTAQQEAASERDARDADLRRVEREDAAAEAEVRAIDAWLDERDRSREKLRSDGVLELREAAADGRTRWEVARHDARDRVTRSEALRDEARRRSEDLAERVTEASARIASDTARIDTDERTLAAARAERARIRASALLRELEGDDVDLDAPGLVDRVRDAADAARRRVLAEAVDGAEDQRAADALERTGRLPPSPDVDRAVQQLRGAGVPAFPGTSWLADNHRDPEERERRLRSDPSAWHGVVVNDDAGVRRAAELLAGFVPRGPVTVLAGRVEVPTPDPDRLVFPGHPAHWDDRAAESLRGTLGERTARRGRERDELTAREQRARTLSQEIQAWRSAWGEGRLASAESDQLQRVGARDRAQVDRDAWIAERRAALQAVADAERARDAAQAEAARAQRHVERVEDLIERFEGRVGAQRARKDERLAERERLAREREVLAERRAEADRSWLAHRDGAARARQEATAHRAERDAVDLHDDGEPSPGVDLVAARATWASLRARWEREVSEDRLQWELDQLQEELREATALERERCRSRQEAVDGVPPDGGRVLQEEAEAEQARTHERAVRARLVEEDARSAVHAQPPRRRESDDLPAGEPPPANAAQARQGAVRWRDARDDAQRSSREQAELADTEERRGRGAAVEADRAQQRAVRLADAVGDAPPEVAPSDLAPAALDEQVAPRVDAVKRAAGAVDAARTETARAGEAVRAVALDAAHEALQSRVKERLKSGAGELAALAPALHTDVDQRIEVVRSTLESIDQDRRLVLEELEKVAMDGVKLLQHTDTASRLPPGLGAWSGESFLRVRLQVPGVQSERQARLEPLLDRLVARGTVPSGRDLVDEAVRELGGGRIEATLLKPDALLRRERLPVTEMQTFSRGQQLTVAILLYCTLARLRARRRGRGARPDAGVLLLDNPVGTCSSVPLLDLQREVARQMRVQLVYTTGVNDPNAVATFPNTVRLRNAHRARESGDLHVTVDDGPAGPSVEAIRVVRQVEDPSG